MNLGMENFWAKGNCFAKYDVELAKSVGLEKPKQSFIHRLATGICTVWNDNPKAFKWVEGVGLISPIINPIITPPTPFFPFIDRAFI